MLSLFNWFNKNEEEAPKQSIIIWSGYVDRRKNDLYLIRNIPDVVKSDNLPPVRTMSLSISISEKSFKEFSLEYQQKLKLPRVPVSKMVIFDPMTYESILDYSQQFHFSQEKKILEVEFLSTELDVQLLAEDLRGGFVGIIDVGAMGFVILQLDESENRFYSYLPVEQADFMTAMLYALIRLFVSLELGVDFLQKKPPELKSRDVTVIGRDIASRHKSFSSELLPKGNLDDVLSKLMEKSETLNSPYKRLRMKLVLIDLLQVGRENEEKED